MLSYALNLLIRYFFIFLIIDENSAVWTDCDADEIRDPMFVHLLKISPQPIQLPGVYNVSLRTTVKSYIPELNVDVEIGKPDVNTHVTQKVFPMSNESWRVYDSCHVIDKTLFGDMASIEHDIDIQIDKLMLGSLEYHAGCPLLPGVIEFTSQPMVLSMDLLKLNILPKDHYVVKVMFNSGLDNQTFGCTQFPINYIGHVIT